MTKSVVHWFRKDLRLHDNPALRNAVNEAENNMKKLRPLYILDPDVYKNGKAGINRLQFLLQCLTDLDINLRKLNLKLYVIKGKPTNVFINLFKNWQVSYLTYQIEIDPETICQDEIVEELALKNNVFIVKRISHTIYDSHEIIKRNNNHAPLTYQKFLSIIQTMHVKGIADNNKAVSSQCIVDVQDSEEQQHPDCYNIPTLQDLQVDLPGLQCLYRGGENEALKCIHRILLNKEWICKFEKPKTSPNSLQPSTTVLSPYLSFGCLSSKLFYFKVKDIEKSCTSHSQPPVSLLGQLLWREFYYTAAIGTKNFDKMVGNPICIQIQWNRNEQFLKAWEDGKTGYPFVDAIMRQLKQEGWIHHLARHMVACFLTRGDMWISWEEGMRVFEKYLLDYDWALNTGNWLWLSASAFFYKYYRVYSPIAFGKRTDKDGSYIKKYVPELKKYPSEFIYEPWKAPIYVQKSTGCIIGEDYPNRIVNHETVYKENISKMANYYRLNKERKALKRPRS